MEVNIPDEAILERLWKTQSIISKGMSGKQTKKRLENICSQTLGNMG